MNAQQPDTIKWSENVIIADGDYIDRVAFDLTVNFERMLDRRIPPVDFSQWAVDIALDGGLRPGKHETQVVLLHDRKNPKLEYFRPADYASELNGQAFGDAQMGEFIINAIATGDAVADKDAVVLDIVNTLLNHGEVRRVMIVPNAEDGSLYGTLRSTLRNVDDEQKRVTLFAMQPMEGGNFRQQILGYSLMNAMGISASEFQNK